jgi:CheY-like chemotaxis protein
MLQILFVDDEPSVLEALRDVLRGRRREWRMHFVSSPEEALETVTTERFDVIVSDLRMPGMDGATLLRKVSERASGTIRIVLSGYAESSLAQDAAEIADAVLSKPCEPEALEAAIGLARASG